ncbi:uncharacterized protein LOC131623123 [Vicia villosa]|uniref:uncharacterized protein LOC131623123 n=1 Tax=Vicia villosa TaxID=3911 RepID=UPI00273BD07C|nr:uncharacterized protein LOC131623123 [Vicia villosa]
MKQGNLTVVEYASKFIQLAKYYPHYSANTAEFSKCVKFENGLHPEIKRAVGYQQIQDNKAYSTYYKRLNEKKRKNQDNGKPYANPAGKGKHKISDEKNPSGGGASSLVKCYRCVESGHRSNECENKVLRCYKCGKTCYRASECKNDSPTCFNCGEQGHSVSSFRSQRKKLLLRLMLIAIIDTGGTYSFISLECATKLELKLSDMNGRMVIDTPASDSVTTTYICSKCPLTIFGKSFVMDLTVKFPDFSDSGKLMFLSAKQVEELLKDESVMLSMFASVQVDREVASIEFPVVREFPYVFPDDISDLPLEREIKFTIELVPGTILVSVAPNRMSASELGELKKQLEELLEKKFV